ncbi:UNVERIFIED_CONTAM: hypothetical protein Sindi_1258900 [Sesamum indicum]
MVKFLKENADMFAWSPSDFKGINSKIIVHRLNMDPTARPVQQKKRTFGTEKNRVIKEEVDKLMRAGYVSEVQYPEMACPKDPYPVLRIDVLVDSTAGRAILDDGRIPGNASATYQRLVNRMFKEMIDRTMEVYVDDMLIKSDKSENHLEYLKQTFNIMRMYRMKLNPAKPLEWVTENFWVTW